MAGGGGTVILPLDKNGEVWYNIVIMRRIGRSNCPTDKRKPLASFSNIRGIEEKCQYHMRLSQEAGETQGK